MGSHDASFRRGSSPREPDAPVTSHGCRKRTDSRPTLRARSMRVIGRGNFRKLMEAAAVSADRGICGSLRPRVLRLGRDLRIVPATCADLYGNALHRQRRGRPSLCHWQICSQPQSQAGSISERRRPRFCRRLRALFVLKPLTRRLFASMGYRQSQAHGRDAILTARPSYAERALRPSLSRRGSAPAVGGKPARTIGPEAGNEQSTFYGRWAGCDPSFASTLPTGLAE